jgi:hypothetical protein
MGRKGVTGQRSFVSRDSAASTENSQSGQRGADQRERSGLGYGGDRPLDGEGIKTVDPGRTNIAYLRLD